MKRFLIVCMLAFLPFLTITAEESKRESIEELLALMKADAMVEVVYSQFEQMLSGVAQQVGVDDSNKEVYEKHMSRMTSLMNEHMSWEQMKEPMIEVYMKHYTEKEIQDMVAFYGSETGRAMTEKMPAVMKDSMMISQSMVQDILPKIQSLSKQLAEDLIAAKAVENDEL